MRPAHRHSEVSTLPPVWTSSQLSFRPRDGLRFPPLSGRLSAVSERRFRGPPSLRQGALVPEDPTQPGQPRRCCGHRARDADRSAQPVPGKWQPYALLATEGIFSSGVTQEEGSQPRGDSGPGALVSPLALLDSLHLAGQQGPGRPSTLPRSRPQPLQFSHPFRCLVALSPSFRRLDDNCPSPQGFFGTKRHQAGHKPSGQVRPVTEGLLAPPPQ